MELKYNPLKWKEIEIKPQKTLQIFITNKCNMKCKGCFDDTISNSYYGQIINKFINHCPEQINKIHIATRGVLHTETSIINKVKSCRFCNIFPNKKIITCPLDISLNKYSTGFENTRCNKSDSCVLQKIVLKRIVNE